MAGAFEQVATGASTERCEQCGVVIEQGHDEDADVRVGSGDTPGGIHAAERTRKVQIHDHDVRGELGGQFDCLLAGCRFGEDVVAEFV